jgi:hypothetical protein
MEREKGQPGPTADTSEILPRAVRESDFSSPADMGRQGRQLHVAVGPCRPGFGPTGAGTLKLLKSFSLFSLLSLFSLSPIYVSARVGPK